MRFGSSLIHATWRAHERLTIATAVAALVGATACKSDTLQPDSFPVATKPRYGVVQIALTDEPIPGVTAVNVCIERVDLIFADGRPPARLEVSRTINLLELQGGVAVSLGLKMFRVGLIQMVRLILCPDGASVVFVYRSP